VNDNDNQLFLQIVIINVLSQLKYVSYYQLITVMISCQALTYLFQIELTTVSCFRLMKHFLLFISDNLVLISIMN